MNKKIFIIPYFGKLPTTFIAWFVSASRNKDFDFLLFTDDVQVIPLIGKEKNVLINFQSFSDFKKLVKAKTGITFKYRPYKICDFRPLFGVIFFDWVKKYEFWGWCDLDVVFGKISDFISDDIYSRYDRILKNGHFCLLRNNQSINHLYVYNLKNKDICYPYVLKTSYSCCFDEIYFNQICNQYGVRTYINYEIFSDTDYKMFELHDINSDVEKASFFIWDNGFLSKSSFDCPKQNKKILYVHLQKRKMENKIDLEDKVFYISSNYISRTLFSNRPITGQMSHNYSVVIKRNIIKSIRFKLLKFFLRIIRAI